ncbi:MAG: ABC transporter permease [Lentisphaeria bacterium]|nr:ABC transporter permease [Lentisphaeria bacterium]
MSFPHTAWSKLRRSAVAMTSLAVILLYLAAAAGFEIHGLLCTYKGETPVYARISQEHYGPPSRRHIFGTDYQGRDVFLRSLAASSTAVKVGTISGTIAVVIGVALGCAAGFRGGRTDDLVVWLYSTIASMPTLLFILAFALLVSRGFLSPGLMGAVKICAKIVNVEPGMLAVYVAVGLTGWVTLCRVVRGETMKLKRRAFVEAAKVAGVPDTVIIFRHILPNVFHLAVIYFTLSFASAVMLEVIVSYLGFGVQSAPSWGVMISDGQERLWRGVWWELAGASGVMFLLVLALNLLGDALRDALDPYAA